MGAKTGAVSGSREGPAAYSADLEKDGWGGRNSGLIVPFFALPCQRAKLGHSWGHFQASSRSVEPVHTTLDLSTTLKGSEHGSHDMGWMGLNEHLDLPQLTLRQLHDEDVGTPRN